MTDTTVTPPVVPPTTPPATTPPVPDTTTPPATTPPDTTTPPAPPADDGEVPTVVEGVKIAVKTDDTVDFTDPEKARQYVSDKVTEGVDQLKNTMVDSKIEQELTHEIESHPEYKPFEARIRRWVNHDNRKSFIRNGFPVKSVILESIAPYLQQIGAEKARLADAEARAKGTVTTTINPTAPSKGIDVSKMTNAEVTAMAELVKSGRYGK